jgi:hypothetical protein
MAMVKKLTNCASPATVSSATTTPLDDDVEVGTTAVRADHLETAHAHDDDGQSVIDRLLAAILHDDVRTPFAASPFAV